MLKVERQERNVLNRKREIQKMATACLIAVFAVNLFQQILVRHTYIKPDRSLAMWGNLKEREERTYCTRKKVPCLP